MADPAELLPDATRRLIRTADALDDGAYAEPSGLPGWSRGHVLAHLALNAEGLAGVLHGIVEDEPTTMYASDEARDRDIETLAGAEPTVVRSRLLGACTDLTEAIAAVPDDRWATEVERTPGGRRFPADQVPVFRLREVEIHHADLAAGYSRADWSVDFCVALLDSMQARPTEEALVAEAVDLERHWVFGSGGPTVRGTVADLAWWVTGRGTGEGLTTDGELPTIGAM